jgi:Tfp pilus assembly protein PilO
MNKPSDPRVFVVLSAVALVVGAGLNYSEWSSVQNMDSKVQDAQKQLSQAQTLASDLEKSKERLSDVESKLVHLEKGVPDYRYVPSILDHLQKFGVACGIDVEGVRPETPPPAPKSAAPAPPYQDVPLEVKGRGTYGNILKFIGALNTFPQIVATRLVTIDPGAAEKGSGIVPLEATIELHTYVFPPEANADAATDTGAPAASGGQVKANG